MQTSFENATQWPPQLAAAFSLKGSALESDYYAPYNKLLHWMFPSWDFVVAPHAVTGLDANELVDYIVLLVMNKGKPAMLLMVKEERKIAIAATRKCADTHMRRLFNDMLEGCPLPALYGVSALGTKICVYKGDTATFDIEPPEDPSVTKFSFPKGYLENQWSVELLTQEGLDEMKSIAAYVQEACAKLPESWQIV